MNPENQSDADADAEGEDFSPGAPPSRVGAASTRTASMSSEVDEELGDDAFVARIGAFDFDSDAGAGREVFSASVFASASTFFRSAFVSVFASASNARSAASTNAARNSSAASSPASRYAVSAEAISLAAALASRDPNVGARDSRANAEPIADPSFTPEGSSSSSSASASASGDGDGDGDWAGRREGGGAVDFDFASGPRRVSPNPASARAAAARNAETSRARSAAGVPRSCPRARREALAAMAASSREARRAAARTTQRMTRKSTPARARARARAKRVERGTSSAPAPARASDGAPPTATHVPAACDHVVPAPHPAGTSRRGKADVRSEARKRLASSRRDARIASSASALSKPRGDVGVAISAVRERSERPSARLPVVRGRWFNFPPTLEFASRAFAAGRLTSADRGRGRPAGQTKNESVFRIGL